ATLRAIWHGTGLVDSIADGETAAVILDKTNYYAEMGGQLGDSGQLDSHIGKVVRGTLEVGDEVSATVDERRHRTQQSHTTTHVANWALREVLGDGVQQKGSLVDPEKLRFDFSHGKSMTEEELGRVEDLVNQCIRKSLPVYAQVVPQEKALKIHGL